MKWFRLRKPPCFCHEDGFDPLSNDGLCHICRGIPTKPLCSPPEELTPKLRDEEKRVLDEVQAYVDRTYSQRIAELEHRLAEATAELNTAKAVIAALKDVVRNQ